MIGPISRIFFRFLFSSFLFYRKKVAFVHLKAISYNVFARQSYCNCVKLVCKKTMLAVIYKFRLNLLRTFQYKTYKSDFPTLLLAFALLFLQMRKNIKTNFCIAKHTWDKHKKEWKYTSNWFTNFVQLRSNLIGNKIICWLHFAGCP